MELTITCPNCGSAVDIDAKASYGNSQVNCQICQHSIDISLTEEHREGHVNCCPICQRRDFYSQKDFNRAIGVSLFVIAAILSIWTYGLSLLALYLLDLFLFRKLSVIAVCYKCKTIFRAVTNIADIPGYDHEMNDRIVYSDHDFQGQKLPHH